MAYSEDRLASLKSEYELAAKTPSNRFSIMEELVGNRWLPQNVCGLQTRNYR